MKTDWYIKLVLTVIALCLICLVVQNCRMIPFAEAQQGASVSDVNIFAVGGSCVTRYIPVKILSKEEASFADVSAMVETAFASIDYGIRPPDFAALQLEVAGLIRLQSSGKQSETDAQTSAWGLMLNAGADRKWSNEKARTKFEEWRRARQK